MTKDSDNVVEILNFIYKHWPVVQPYVPKEVIPVCRGFGQSDGICSHPNLASDSWVHSRGCEQFVLEATPPDAFFWMGLQDRLSSEYFFLMWYRNHRRFWFYDQYLSVASNYSSPEKTLEFLNAALERWISTTGDVIYSGPWGWFNPETQRFTNRKT